MTSKRDTLKLELQQYVSDTYTDAGIIQSFTNNSEQWIHARQTEIQTIYKIKGSEELSSALKLTLSGLKDMQCFLDAMERLAVTSVYVFQKNHNPVMSLSPTADLKMCSVIQTAGILCPFLILFKRDHEKFFCPEVLNKDILLNQLQYYIKTMRSICDGWKSTALISLKQPKIVLKDLSENIIEKMLSQILVLIALRKDPHFRMVNLFKDRSQSFRQKFSELKPQIECSISELEGCAWQLDSMNKGARISGVVGSLTGITSGVLSILGLVLTPVTAGASLVLTAVGAGVGGLSGVQGLVTTATEIGVNKTQSDRAKEVLDKCVELMNELPEFLTDVILQHFKCISECSWQEYAEATYGGGVFTDNLVGIVSTIKTIFGKKTGKVMADATYDVAKASVQVSKLGNGGLRLANLAKIWSASMNAVFAGVDIYFLCREAMSLAEGTETELSQWIRARTALWDSEIESWQKICDSLVNGERVSEKYKNLLEQAFYP